MSWEPTINDRGEIAWQELGEIWKYDGLNSNKISAGNGGNHNLYMNNNGDVVWMGSGNDLWIFDGLLTSNFTNSPDIYENFPKINDNGQIIYEGHASGQNTNVYFYDGITHKNISNSSYGAGSAQINNDNLIVWNGTNENGDMEIYLSDVSEVINLSNNPNGADQRPFINENGEIIWMGYDGNDFEVLIAKPVSCFIKVTIDIKPGSYPNYINNNGHGVIPVAILGSVDFDCTQVDPETVSLEGLGIKMVGKSNKFLAHYEDINHDGYDDLVLKIEDTDAVFQEGQTTATLSGNLYEEYGGAEIEGTDTICIVP